MNIVKIKDYHRTKQRVIFLELLKESLCVLEIEKYSNGFKFKVRNKRYMERIKPEIAGFWTYG